MAATFLQVASHKSPATDGDGNGNWQEVAETFRVWQVCDDAQPLLLRGAGNETTREGPAPNSNLDFV